MNKEFVIAITIVFLIFFDFLFFNIKLLYINITLLRIIILGVFFTLIVKQIANNKLLISESRFVNYIFLFFILWILYGLFQVTWAIDLRSALKQLYYLTLYIVLIYVVIAVLQSKYVFVKVNNFLYYISIFFIAFGLIELNFNIHFPTSRIISQPELYFNINRATAVFYNENDFSFFLTLIAPMFLVNIQFKKGIKRLLNIFWITSTLYIIVGNDSKLSLIAIILEVAVLMFLTVRKRKTSFFLYSLVVFSFLISQKSYLESAYKLIEQQLYNQAGSTSTRLELFFSGIELLTRSYFLGVGPGNFESNIKLITKGQGINGIINAHNWWIEILANYGLIIFLMYIFTIFYLMIYLNRVRKSPNNVYVFYGTFLLVSYAGFIISSMSSSSIFYNWYQWFHLALSLSLINIFKDDISKHRFG